MTESTPLPQRAWLTVGLLWGVGFLNYLDRIMIASMHKSVVEAIPMTEAQFGLLTSVFLWVYAALSPFGGFMADRFDRSRVIVFSLFAWSALTWLTGHAKTVDQLLTVRALMGISEAAYLPAALALIADYHRGATRSLAIAIHNTGVGVGAGFGGFGGWLADRHPWGYAFNLFGCIGLVYSVVLVFALRRPAGDSPTETKPAHAGQPDSIGTLLSCGSFYLLIIYWGLYGVGGWALVGWLPTYLKEHFALSQGEAGLSATGYLQAATLVGLLVGGAWADYWSRRNPRARVLVAITGMFVAAPGLLLAANAGSMSVLIVGVIIFGMARCFADCNTMPMLCLVAGPRYRATAYGLMNLAAGVAGGLTIYAGGVLRDAHVNITHVFEFGAACLAVGGILLVFMRPAAPTVSTAP